jgi:hypothetical protein
MPNTIHTYEHVHTMFGVEGHMFNRILNEESGLFLNQKFIATRPFKAQGCKAGSTITVVVSFDDECKNGHQTFDITGHVQEPGARDWFMGGRIHGEITKYFPEPAHLIKWHLVSTDGPMHYIANTVYHAGNRDHNGHVAGEPNRWDHVIKFGDFPITFKIKKGFQEWLTATFEHLQTTLKTNPNRQPWPPVPVPVEHEKKPGETYEFDPKYTFQGFERKWYECPFDSKIEAEQFSEALARYPFKFEMLPTGYSKGKERNFAAARNAAVWPEATDEQLSLPKDQLTELLKARLPMLQKDFRADMEAAGFLWEQPPSKLA